MPDQPQTEPVLMSRLELELMRLGLENEIAGLQLQLEWVENAITNSDQ